MVKPRRGAKKRGLSTVESPKRCMDRLPDQGPVDRGVLGFKYTNEFGRRVPGVEGISIRGPLVAR